MHENEAQGPAAYPLYDAEFEHDACGMGFVASIAGDPSHRLIQLALRGLTNLAHRGAVGADGQSADGAGLTIQLPVRLLERDVPTIADHDGLVGVAMVFLPQDPADAEHARLLIETAAVESGAVSLGWRLVPTDPDALGQVAHAAMPRVEQLILGSAPATADDDDGALASAPDDSAFETLLYAARRDAEARLSDVGLDAYIVSMSSRTVVYKALVQGEVLTRFYPDLADPETVSALAVFHQRFATNTTPQWHLAQPFRRIAHNGEVNTLLGNRAWMAAREGELAASEWGRQVPSLAPVLSHAGSDTASLDEALDLLITSGCDVLEAMASLIPEAWERMPGIDPELRAFYEVRACVGEPWEGPAGLVFTDGAVVAASMDRNGLRPARYQRTSDGLVIVGSEVGILDLPPGEVLESGRIGPGRMLAVDTRAGRFVNNREIKRTIAKRRPYHTWIQERLRRVHPAESIDTTASDPSVTGASAPVDTPRGGSDAVVDLDRLQIVHGYTAEELRLILTPMAEDGKDGIGSMGDDSPLSVFSDASRTLYSYLRQRFAQVTNPPMDSIRERLVMSLDTYLGKRGSWLEPGPDAAARTHIPSPIVTDATLDLLRTQAASGLHAITLKAEYEVGGGGPALSAALQALRVSAANAVRDGYDFVVVSDRMGTPGSAPIPMLLAVSAVHHHLIDEGLRTRVSIGAEVADARDVHHFATLIGFGAEVVNPWLALATVRATSDADDVERRFVQASESGLLKIMAKMGICSVASYHGAQIFEAVGLGRQLIDDWFPAMRSRIGGIEIQAIADEIAARMDAAGLEEPALDKGGWFRYRRGPEYHANEPPVWRALHAAVQDGGDEEYRTYADLVHGRPPTSLRDLLTFSSDREPISIDRVESVADITRRFQTGAMSLGALSAETHEDIARAMNRIGAQSNSGEGGEHPDRYTPGGPMNDANSRIKQVASGRFGVTAGYLAAADEIEIKMAQGSKPGEGGQLPGFKVSAYIAARRHVRPGTPLISPPPHHDIYSIEDLAQLIYDLRTVNPRARIAVKLVASEGVGTIAAGVAKAYADVVHISGADGGTGASPLTSIKHAGAPWELGVAEAQQTLVRNGLRNRIMLTTDGGLHTGRDVVKAALLGAERYGFGTAALIALGCKMARQCHSNTCPVGIATQAEHLRKKYFGTPEMLIRFFEGVAGEVREILAHLGYERLDEVIGRADLLEQLPTPADARWEGVDLSSLLVSNADAPLVSAGIPNRGTEERFDDAILQAAAGAVSRKEDFEGTWEIRNYDRTVGARLSGAIAALHGDAGLPDGRIDIGLVGSAGQSLGAWLVDGVHIRLEGEANDYVGKGMTGGSISIRRPARSGIMGGQAVLAGNTLLYGATGGSLFVAGRVGDRFAVRNSGALAVVEGAGKHACEYMTGGIVAVLGPTGRNFGAGMSGGRAYVLDSLGDFPARLNPGHVSYHLVTEDEALEELRLLLEAHRAATGSQKAARVLNAWPASATRFWRVEPRSAPEEAQEWQPDQRVARLASSMSTAQRPAGREQSSTGPSPRFGTTERRRAESPPTPPSPPTS